LKSTIRKDLTLPTFVDLKKEINEWNQIIETEIKFGEYREVVKPFSFGEEKIR